MNGIQFTEIDTTKRVPGAHFEFDVLGGSLSLPLNIQNMLIIAQKTDSGIAPELVPFPVGKESDVAINCGNGSTAHKMVQAALAAQPRLNLTVIPLLDAGAATAATGTFPVSGTATTPGVIIANVNNEFVRANFSTGEDATAIADKLNSALDANAGLPTTHAATTGTVTLTAKNKGTVGNQIKIGAVVTPSSGVTVVPTAMTGGATDPVIQPALDVAFPVWYNLICIPYNDQTNLITLRNHVETVSDGNEQRPAIGVFGLDDTIANGTTLTDGLNSWRLVGAYCRGTRSADYELGAAKCAVMALSIANNAGKPMDDLELRGIGVPLETSRLSEAEKNTLLFNGLTPIYVGPGERMLISRSITTYIKNPQGIPDDTMLDVSTATSLDYFRFSLLNRLVGNYVREKNTETRRQSIRSDILAVMRSLENPALEILHLVDEYQDGVIVEASLTDPTAVVCQVPAPVVPNLHKILGVIQLVLRA